MKSVLSLVSAGLFFSLVACGTDTSVLNSADVLPQETDSQISVESGEELGLGKDACSLKAPQLTFTLASGGSVTLEYKFFWLTKGDRVRIKNADSGAVVYDSESLSQAAGVLSIPISSLGAGRFVAEGFINTYLAKQSPLADCRVPGRIVIRNK